MNKAAVLDTILSLCHHLQVFCQRLKENDVKNITFDLQFFFFATSISSDCQCLEDCSAKIKAL